ncbi:ABC transporter ATP-binding protein [Burkholderia sola]|uniref:ABC transporter ATP-binding protein n=1 Tax=Burkholderia sola TaxID=2843302 RepID=UPI0023DE0D13|nr:ABC transporter ATP-binding protein [Burkholderia sola]MDF3084390.1 ABC transporter ATP-binding protein [Burkholderia sola]
MMSAIEFRGVSKNYGGGVALDNINMSVASGEFFSLLGPSGSGKTTLLNTVSGMVSPSSGSVLIDGRDVTHIPPRHRGLGMVFQNYALLPHMSVFDNVAFPLRIRKMPKKDIEREVMGALELVRLKDFAHRKPKELSGGQQQRVSIARCLVYKPMLILMDEPLGALDKKLRQQLQFELKRIHAQLGVTILYVTHDQEEALVMSDRICVMNHACVEQVGAPKELYLRPINEFVADFLGESNVIPGEVVGVSGDSADVRTETGAVVRCTLRQSATTQQRIKVMVRPECVRLAARQDALVGCRALVKNVAFVGDAFRYTVQVGSQFLTVLQNSHSLHRVIEPGSEVWIDWSASDAISLAA